MSDNAARLLKLAQAEFPDLTAPEREVLRAAGTGEVADLAQWGTPPSKPKKYNPGGGPLRSRLVEWLCTDAQAKQLVHRKGLRIKNATIDAKLDLERTEVPFSFALHNCRLPGLNAQSATLKDRLYLNHCRVDGEVDLNAATISGQLQCDGAWFLNRGGMALIADRATIGSSVSLSDGFRAVGAVRLLGTKITGQLDCKEGCFLNRNGNAFSADNATISSDVRLSQGFRAVGAVRLPGANIAGQLDCEDGTFCNATGRALVLDCATILDTIFLEPKNVQGEISLNQTVVTNALRMLTPALAMASLNLSGAKVGLLFDARDSWPEQGKLQLDGFHYDNIHINSPIDVKSRLDWLSRQPQDRLFTQPFDELINFYRKSGLESAAIDVHIAKERKRSTLINDPLKRIWLIILDVTIRFGYRPHYAIAWLLGIVLTCATAFYLGSNGMTESISYYTYNSSNHSTIQGKIIASDYPTFNPFVYSIDVALPIIDLQQERYWMPNSHHNGTGVPFYENGNFLWAINRLEILFGWILVSVIVTGLASYINKSKSQDI